ncbi:hypothetical protein TEA_021894 [Camellia sinensis var. sinensis]|uniref:SNARE-complex protein Syntaxin-18 N-terminal domain-containing protein n=1 Tax=Camellia sinensis var. sinensis TaxID=542762 RepID=A0A4S4EDD2_CAMSN|nr:hypothetical protein TEA_021894 [Camellia sinensis var. sinensis]
MARIRDRTEDFKDAVHRTALSLGYNEAKLAAILASFIMHKPRQRSSFTKAALKTLESIETLDQFLMKHKKDYIDLHRTTEQERDSIEHEVTIFVKACKEQIDILKTSINDEESNSKGWLGIKGDHSNVDTIAHKHGVSINTVKTTSNQAQDSKDQAQSTTAQLITVQSQFRPQLKLKLQGMRLPDMASSAKAYSYNSRSPSTHVMSTSSPSADLVPLAIPAVSASVPSAPTMLDIVPTVMPVVSVSAPPADLISSVPYTIPISVPLSAIYTLSVASIPTGWAQIGCGHETSNPPSVRQIGGLEKINPHPSANPADADMVDWRIGGLIRIGLTV